MRAWEEPWRLQVSHTSRSPLAAMRNLTYRPSIGHGSAAIRWAAWPALAASAATLAEAATGRHTAVFVICAALLAAATLSALRAGRRLRIWAVSKAPQVCYWIPETDETNRQGRTSPRQRRLRPARRPT
jgi:hypothetical protein